MTAKRFWYSVIVVVVVQLALSISVAVYANYVAAEANRKWCGLVSTMDDAYSQSPQQPTTQIGKRIATEMRELRVSFGC